MSKEAEICDICKKPLDKSELEFAREQGNHPGYLGLLDPKCYSKLTENDPTLPWTDPISGETDYQEMESDLGVSTGSTDEEET